MTQDSHQWHKIGYGHELYVGEDRVAFVIELSGLRGHQFYWRLTEAGRRHIDGTCETLRAARKEAAEAYEAPRRSSAPFQETGNKLLKEGTNG